MKCTILIPVCTELDFLKIGIYKIKQFRHPEIEQEIIIADQTDFSQTLQDLFGSDPEIKIVKIPRIDAGYPIDIGAKMATGDYFCSLDADAFPIHRNWLYLPIKLIERYNLSFVGKQTGLHISYPAHGNFRHINNYYRVSKTNIAKKIAEDVSFMRWGNRSMVNFIPTDTRWNSDCDNGVVAQWYADQIDCGGKVSLALNKTIGFTSEMGIYGMVIDDLVFHMVFGFGEEWIKDLSKTLGSQYLEWKEKIKNGEIESVSESMLSATIPHHPIETDREYWDGKTAKRLSPNDEMYQFIETIKKSQHESKSI